MGPMNPDVEAGCFHNKDDSPKKDYHRSLRSVYSVSLQTMQTADSRGFTSDVSV